MATTAARRYERYETRGNAALSNARVHAPQAEPRIRTRERPYAAPRVKVREAGHVSVFAVLGFLVVGAMAVLLLFSYIQLMTTADQTVTLRKELQGLQQDNVTLRTQYELAYDLKTIEDAVLSTGMMVKPQSGQIVILDLSEPDNMIVFAEQAEPSVFETLFAWAKSMISGRME